MLMQYPKYWNHSVAYFGYIKNIVADCKDILDVGCGDGSLIRYLDDQKRVLIGIDADKKCIDFAANNTDSDNIKFICSRFEIYNFEKKFDAIIFNSSIHHMDMKDAVNKAKTILVPGGIILIVGLAKPSNVFDWVLEIFRVIPCAIISKVKHMRSSAANFCPASGSWTSPYNFCF